MPNMSYCRFENTVTDMQDCINAIEERDTDELSSYEVNALSSFLDLAREITNLEYDIAVSYTHLTLPTNREV